MSEIKNIENIIALSSDLRWQIGDDFHDNLAEGIYADASEIVENVVHAEGQKKSTDWIQKLIESLQAEFGVFLLCFCF